MSEHRHDSVGHGHGELSPAERADLVATCRAKLALHTWAVVAATVVGTVILFGASAGARALTQPDGSPAAVRTTGPARSTSGGSGATTPTGTTPPTRGSTKQTTRPTTTTDTPVPTPQHLSATYDDERAGFTVWWDPSDPAIVAHYVLTWPDGSAETVDGVTHTMAVPTPCQFPVIPGRKFRERTGKGDPYPVTVRAEDGRGRRSAPTPPIDLSAPLPSVRLPLPLPTTAAGPTTTSTTAADAPDGSNDHPFLSGTPLTFTAIVSPDAGPDWLRLTWSDANDPALAADGTATTLSYALTAPDVLRHSITVVVTDRRGFQATATVDVVVQAGPHQ